YKSKGKELLLNGYGPRPAFWRAPTDNDYGWKMPKICRLWKQVSEQTPNAASVKTSQKGNTVQVEVKYNLDSLKSTWETQYTIMGNGAIKVENLLETKDGEVPVIPRIGMKMQIPFEFTQLEYLGRGPWENYCDRNSSTFVGRYKSAVTELYVPYIRPQENGHRTDVRWMALTQDDGSGLLVVADSLIEFNALNNPIEDFDAGPDKDKNLQHSNDINPKKLVEVHIDYRQIGVAGDDSWGGWPHEPYLIRPSAMGYRYGFTIIPISSLKEVESLSKTEF
ncbi:MAG: beta-galactosidase small subunit, partial [Calditrichaceae bacterium]